MEAKLVFVYRDPGEAKAVSEAILPDNSKTPFHLIVKTSRKDKKVITIIRYDGEKLLTFASTIDDLLSCIAAAEKTLSAIKKHK